MAGLFGIKAPQAAAPSRLAGMQVQTSIYGKPIPRVYGTNRIGGNLLDYDDFKSTPVYNSQPAGKGGRSVQTVTSYDYSAAVAIALCEGPIQSLAGIWDNNGHISTVTIIEEYVVPAGGGSITVNQSANFQTDYGATRDDDYSYSNIDDYGDPAASGDLNGVWKLKMHLAASRSNVPQGQYYHDVSTPGQYTFSADDAGKTVNITYSYSVPNTVNDGTPLESLDLTLFNGGRPQTAWGYLTANHPTKALSYAGLAYVAAPGMSLGVSATMPQLAYAVSGLKVRGGGVLDANPADVLTDIWTDQVGGLGLDASLLGDLTQWSNFCEANGIFLSPALEQQAAASQLLQELLEVTNSVAAWFDGKLQIIPRGDTSVAANGVLYSPATQPIYDLTDDDFVAAAGQAPVQIERADLADAYNDVQIEYVDRSNDYNTAICEEKSDRAINDYGLRQDSVRTYHSITSSAVAALAANAILRRNINIIATYKWSTDWRFSLLSPMDLVTLTDSGLGLDKTPVRITKITESANGTLAFEAEEFPWGTAQPTAYPKEPGAPFIPQDQVDPGNVITPLIFESTSRQNNYTGYELQIAVAGDNANWGGCGIWASADGTTYQRIGQTKTPANMGTLSAALAAGTDPDTANTLAVDLTSSLGQLVSATDAEADQYQTLCYVDGELIAFGTATLSAANKYNLTYLRRGVYGTTIAAHAIGSRFARLDSAIFEWAIDPAWVGKTLYLKFTSFNAYGKMEQPLSAATAYTYSIAGSGPGAIGSDGIVVPNAIDFSKGYAGRLPQANTDPTVLLSSTGTQRNQVPDSDLKLGWSFWTQDSTGCTIVVGPDGQNRLQCNLGSVGANGNGARTVSWTLGAGTYTLSAMMATPGMTAGKLIVEIGQPEIGSGTPCELDMPAGTAASRRSKSFTLTSTQTVNISVGQWNDAGGNSAGVGEAWAFQLEPGSVMTAYRPNFADDATGYLPSAALDPTLVGNVATALETANAKAEITIAGTAPATPQIGDIWYNTSVTPAAAMMWNGSAWVAADAAAQGQASAASALAGTKAKVTIGGAAPGSPATGDIWVNDSSGTNVVETWTGVAWSTAADVTSANIPTQVLTNGSFEDGLTGWRTLQGAPAIDTSQKKYGLQSVKCHGVAIGQNVILLAGHTYTAKAWVKTDGSVTGNGSYGAGLNLTDSNGYITVQKVGGGTAAPFATNPGVLLAATAATDWTSIQFTFSVSTTCELSLNVEDDYGTTNANANAWFDGVVLEDITGGADVTSANTSANTANVGSQSVAQAEQAIINALAALDTPNGSGVSALLAGTVALIDALALANGPAEAAADVTRSHVQNALAVGVTSHPAIPTSWAVIPEMSRTVTATASSDTFLVVFAGTLDSGGGTGASVDVSIQVYVDGAAVSASLQEASTSSPVTSIAISLTWIVTGLSAGSHTIAVYNQGGGTGGWFGTSRSLAVQQIS